MAHFELYLAQKRKMTILIYINECCCSTAAAAAAAVDCLLCVCECDAGVTIELPTGTIQHNGKILRLRVLSPMLFCAVL